MKRFGTLITTAILGCGASTAATNIETSIKPSESASAPTVSEKPKMDLDETAGIYRFVANTCAKRHEELIDDILSRIESCLCESVGDAREACLEDQGVPLYEENYNPFREARISEEICRDELATENGVSFKEAQAANRIVQAKKLKNQYLKFVGDNAATFSYEDAQAYTKLLQEMHAKRMFDHEDVLETLDVVDRKSFIKKYIEALRQTFLDKGHYEEVSILEWLAGVVAAPEFHSMMGEAAAIGRYLMVPPGPECLDHPDDDGNGYDRHRHKLN